MLASVREDWLENAIGELSADARVAGVGLVGSLGRGDADDWSDIDVLVVVNDEHFDKFIDPAANALWRDAELFFDARQNAPRGATSVGALYLKSGLPVGVDWYLYPASMAAWPSDSRVAYERAGVRQTELVFAEFNAQGARQSGTRKSAGEVREAKLVMALIAGKLIARRSPSATPMIEFLAGTSQSFSDAQAALHALGSIVDRLSTDAPPQLVEAIESYLAIVESVLV